MRFAFVDGKSPVEEVRHARRHEREMHLPVVVLVVAIVTSLVSRVLQRFGVIGRLRDDAAAPEAAGATARHVLVCMAAPVREPWRDALLHFLSQAAHPEALRFGVLLECTTPRDAELGDVDPELRGFVRVVHARARSGDDDPAARVRRLARRFVKGDETLVVLADHRLRLARGWDATVTRILGGETAAGGGDTATGGGGAGVAASTTVVLSAPAASQEHAGAFPTLRRSDARGVVRGGSRRFEGSRAAPLAVPSVCWCAEFTAARPQVFADRRWPVAGAGYVTQTRALPDAVFLVPVGPLVLADERLEERYADGDRGTSAATRCAAHERVGLTRDEEDVARIAKFGSANAARLAVEFA